MSRGRVRPADGMQITGHDCESAFNYYDIVDTNDGREAMRRRAAAGSGAV